MVLAVLWTVCLVKFCSAFYLWDCIFGSKTNDDSTPLKQTTPITLNLVNPDESNIDVHMENESEVSLKEFSPKNTFHISSVIEADKELWTSNDGLNRCLSSLIYKNGDEEVLNITVVERMTRCFNYFEKTDGKWKSIAKKEDFLTKLKAIMAGYTSTLSPPSEEYTTPAQ